MAEPQRPDLRELLQDFDIGLGEMGFAQRLRTDSELRAAVDAWFEAQAAAPRGRPRRATGCASSRTSTSACSPRPPP